VEAQWVAERRCHFAAWEQPAAYTDDLRRALKIVGGRTAKP
jgi:hypothetical protein